MRLLFLSLFFLSNYHMVWSQNAPSLRDDVLICNRGALPFYVSCEDSACGEQTFYDSGKLKSSGSCINGRKAGRWISFFENGDTMSSGEIKNGLLVDSWFIYYNNGNKKAAGKFIIGRFEIGCTGSNYYDSASIRIGDWNFWFNDGSKMITCHFVKNEFGEEELDGEFVEWHANGKKKAEGVYKKGVKTGKWTYWYSNGQTQRKEEYAYRDCSADGPSWFECPTGTWKYWDDDGNLELKETYKDGVIFLLEEF